MDDKLEYPIIKDKITPSVDKNYSLKSKNTTNLESKNQNSIKVPKVLVNEYNLSKKSEEYKFILHQPITIFLNIYICILFKGTIQLY